jgi:hypothetical protein
LDKERAAAEADNTSETTETEDLKESEDEIE